MTLAGSDSGGGAGIQADIKVFAALGVHGTSVVTCVTAQNPSEVRAIQPISARMVIEQMKSLSTGLRPRAMKTGLLYSSHIVRAVLEGLSAFNNIPWVVDPVMVATSGALLLKPSAIRLYQDRIFPKATLITPNLQEARRLLGTPLKTSKDAEKAAECLFHRHGTPVLLKGGHLGQRSSECRDYLYDTCGPVCFVAPRHRVRSTHGTGCTLSAAITAYLAMGHPLRESVALGKEFTNAAIRHSTLVGPHSVLNVFPVRPLECPLEP